MIPLSIATKTQKARPLGDQRDPGPTRPGRSVTLRHGVACAAASGR
jgi:hypothetical protein